MTEYQAEILKNREDISFFYDKYDLKLSNNKTIIVLNLKYYYHFDVSKIGKRGEDFSFEHDVKIEFDVHELLKNEIVKKEILNNELVVDEKNEKIKNENITRLLFDNIKEKVETKEFKKIINCIGIVESISYYKIIPVRHVIINGELGHKEKQWWEKLFFEGLGEYRYLNGLLSIEKDRFVNIVANNFVETVEKQIAKTKSIRKGFLIPVGGGKDSVVTLDLLKKYKQESSPVIVGSARARIATTEIAGFKEKDTIFVTRTFDKKMKELNDKGYFNGHIPFSAVLAFLNLVPAYLLERKYIVLSNESSANESTVAKGNINHQYSKTTEFEKDFREYVFNFLKLDIEYFSILRPLTEVGIAKIFANLKKYHKDFNSCNVGSKSKEWNWCCNCPKCLFVYIILSPMLYKQELVNIFGEDVFENKELLTDMYKLIGKEKTKPFECVGTKEETIFSLELVLKKMEEEQKGKLPYLLEKYKEVRGEILKTSACKSLDTNLYYIYDNNNFIPEEIEEIVKQRLKES